ncbi:hypothetical protein GGR61_002349 [Xanthomonas arboricola]|nr:hypothetical protein [Xanthomonas sp. 3058]
MLRELGRKLLHADNVIGEGASRTLRCQHIAESSQCGCCTMHAMQTQGSPGVGHWIFSVAHADHCVSRPDGTRLCSRMMRCTVFYGRKCASSAHALSTPTLLRGTHVQSVTAECAISAMQSATSTTQRAMHCRAQNLRSHRHGAHRLAHPYAITRNNAPTSRPRTPASATTALPTRSHRLAGQAPHPVAVRYRYDGRCDPACSCGQSQRASNCTKPVPSAEIGAEPAVRRHCAPSAGCRSPSTAVTW